ncbi:energy transducer TonB [Sulfuriflexus sp.]|uniref:energy transducer TonB n=1 Tax=Sulfuriflexus sp. TaxID=2015443 RepID=UPI0028CDB681|nr:energy transducer TonB [Sulfuriflexus sp.]MDT8403136.1 energy transducer TonB [Sulfuriflexus sp.]
MTHTAPLPTPTITAFDRFGLTLFFAVVIHALIILGITFSSESLNKPEHIQTMEITLVQSRSEKPVEDAQFLAQANQQGSGNTPDIEKPVAPRRQEVATPHKNTGTAPESSPAVTPREQTPQTQQQAVMTADAATKPVPDRPQSASQQNKTPSASQMISHALQIASASAEYEQQKLANKKQKRSKFITASTTEYNYAAYQDAWRLKVERIGRINYPEEATRRRLTGKLILTVVLRADGSIQDISLVQSSGNRILDDAAQQIVRLAAPYAPFPDNIRAETDLLHITRTWIFQSGNRLTSR